MLLSGLKVHREKFENNRWKRVIHSGNGTHSHFKFTQQQQSSMFVELLPATGIASSSVKFFHQKLHHLLRKRATTYLGGTEAKLQSCDKNINIGRFWQIFVNTQSALETAQKELKAYRMLCRGWDKAKLIWHRCLHRGVGFDFFHPTKWQSRDKAYAKQCLHGTLSFKSVFWSVSFIRSTYLQF